jgi:hypothetical protein
MIDTFNGDPILVIDGNGSDIIENNGNIVLDSIPGNIVQMCLLCGTNNIHHDLLIGDENHKLESKVYEEIKKPINMQMLSDVENAAKYDLKYLTDNNIIEVKKISAKNTEGRQVELFIEYIFINKNEIYNFTIIYDNDKIYIKY